MDVLVIASPAVPLLGLGLLKVRSDHESLIALVPFVLVAVLAVVAMLAVYGARDRSARDSSEPYWPKSRVGASAYVAGLFLLPAMLLAGATISIVNREQAVATRRRASRDDSHARTDEGHRIVAVRRMRRERR